MEGQTFRESVEVLWPLKLADGLTVDFPYPRGGPIHVQLVGGKDLSGDSKSPPSCDE